MRPILATLRSAGRSLGEGLLHLFYPRVCWVCQQIQPPGQPAICGDCASQFTRDDRPTCPRCASTVGPYVELANGCSSCRASPLAFDQAFRLAPYEGLLKETILRMKQPNGEGLAEAVADFWADRLAERLRPLAPDVVLPVPLHWLRQWRRGFNASEVLARALAARLKAPCRPGWLRRCRRTEQQKEFPPAETAKRWENVNRAFAVRSGADLAGKTIVLVDDVLTTGATASEAARPMRALKPKSIIAAVVAHGR